MDTKMVGGWYLSREITCTSICCILILQRVIPKEDL